MSRESCRRESFFSCRHREGFIAVYLSEIEGSKSMVRSLQQTAATHVIAVNSTGKLKGITRGFTNEILCVLGHCSAV